MHKKTANFVEVYLALLYLLREKLDRIMELLFRLFEEKASQCSCDILDVIYFSKLADGNLCNDLKKKGLIEMISVVINGFPWDKSYSVLFSYFQQLNSYAFHDKLHACHLGMIL